MAIRSAAFDLVTAAEDEAFQIAMSIRPDTEAHAVAQREIVTSLRKALDARQERIVISRSTINRIKWTAAVVLIASQSRPFTGQVAVRPDLLIQVIPKE